MFKEKLKKLREEKGLSQNELADKIFVSRSAIAKWENGFGMPGKESMDRLCEFFNISRDELLKEEDALIVIKNVSKLKKGFVVGCSILLIILLAITIFVSYVHFRNEANTRADERYYESISPIVDSVEIDDNYIGLTQPVGINIHMKFPLFPINNKKIIPDKVVFSIDGNEYEKTFYNREISSIDSFYGMYVGEFDLNAIPLSIGTHYIRIQKIQMYYEHSNSFKYFDVQLDSLEINMYKNPSYSLMFKLQDYELDVQSINTGITFEQFKLDNYYYMQYLNELVINKITVVNNNFPGINLSFDNEWELSDIGSDDPITANTIVTPVVSGLKDIESRIKFDFDNNENYYARGGLLLGIDEEVNLSFGFNNKYINKRNFTILEYDSTYLDCYQQALIGKKEGHTKIKIKVNLEITSFEKELNISIIPYKLFKTFHGIAFLKYDLQTDCIIEEIPASHTYLNYFDEQFAYRQLTGETIQIVDYALVGDESVDYYRTFIPIFNTSFDKDIFKIENSNYDEITNTITISKDEELLPKFSINSELLSEAEKQFFVRRYTYYSYYKIISEDTTNYEIVLYCYYPNSIYTIMKKINVVVI